MNLIPRSLRASIVAATALATLVAAAAMGFAHYQAHRSRSESDLKKLLKLSASESAARVQQWLEDRLSSAASVASSLTLIAELRRIQQFHPQDDEYFLSLYRLKRELDQNTLSYPFIYEITLHDPESGDVLLASTGEDVAADSVEHDRRGFAEALEQGHLWFSRIFGSEIRLPDENGRAAYGVPCIFIAAPIRDGEDLFGVVRIRCRSLLIGKNLLRAANYSDGFGTSDAYVVNRDGVLLSPTRFEDEFKQSGRIKTRSILELTAQPPGVDSFTSAFRESRALFGPDAPATTVDLKGYAGLQGRAVVGAWTKVKGTDWVCIAEINRDEAYAPLSRLMRTTLAISLAIGALVIGLTTVLATRIVSPLKRLSIVAARLASGDRTVRCRIRRPDEIGGLAAAFDNLADSIESTLQRLETNAEHLATSNEKLESELSERRRAEQQLRDANAFLDSVIDNIPTMLFMKSAEDLRIVRFNKAGEELVGLPREELIGKTDFDLYPREEAEFFAKKDREVLQGLKMVEIEGEQLLTRNGPRVLHTKKIPICDEQGRPQSLLGISEDITEKKLTLEALQSAKDAAVAANRAKGEFLANMSHEIRTPMNAIIGMTDLVLDTTLDPTQRDYLNIVAESAESLLSIINEILDFSKIDAGKLQLESVDFHVREEIGDTLKSLGIRAHTKGLELAWRVHPDVPAWLSGDAVRLRQVLVNLVGNAIKFTSQGEVFVNVACEPAQGGQSLLHISVRDTGVGIPAEKSVQIFSAFEQADKSTTREFGGTGLGLAIASRIATAMGGRVWMESVAGKGSTFHFTGEFGLGAESHVAEELPNLTGLPVLAVDDNATNRLILEELLAGWGMSVVAVSGGPEAIRTLQEIAETQQPLPLVISDMHMPSMDGFMFVERLRSIPELRGANVIMLTSGGREGDMQRCAELGIRTLLIKPVKPSELLDTIVVSVGRSEARETSRSRQSFDPTSLPSLKILLAEDGKANQMVATGLLEKWGHEVAVAGNGEQAVSLWKAGAFDAILMDVQMPTLDGLEATRQIRQLEGERRIPIIALTARAMPGDRERCLAAGMDGFISKPVRKHELYRVLERLMGVALPSDEPSLAEPTTGIVDWRRALENVDGDADLLLRLLAPTRDECEKLFVELENAIAIADGSAVRIAHTIKGGARTIAAGVLESSATAVELAADEGDFDRARQGLPPLKRALQQLREEIASRTAADGTLRLP